MYLVTGKKAVGSCGEPWNLENIEERAMIINDKVIDNQCQLLADIKGVHKKDLYGDINLVNGVPFPRMPLMPKTYRFRFVNTAVSRPYKIQIRDERGNNIAHKMCQMVGSDGGYRYNAPVPFPSAGLLMGVSERWDVVCDFSAYSRQTLYWWNTLDEDQMTDVPMFCHSHLLAKITVAPAPTPNLYSTIDPTLPMPFNSVHMNRILSAADISKAVAMANDGDFHREFEFKRKNGMWTINGETWDTAKIAADDVGQNTW